MRKRIILALAVREGASSAAFVNSGWVASTRRDPTSSRAGGWRGLNAHTLTLDVGSCMIPHPEKVARGGEDAYFVLENDLGVFDGVGGWGAKGHDPGVFTRGFAQAVAGNITAQRLEGADSLRQSEDEGGRQERFANEVDLKQALEHGTRNAPGKGTCTACVVTFDPVYGTLNGVNIGDSGALLVRRDTRGTPFVALRTSTQRHKFNQPYQLGTGSRDKAADAEPFLFYVREGDVVVLATDGLLDNLYEAEILRCISEVSKRDLEVTPPALPEKLLDLAGVLARWAHELSLDKERLTPWEEEAVAAGVVPMRGEDNEAAASRCGQGWSWNPTQWGLSLERAVRAGVRSVQGDNGEATRGRDGNESVMSEEDMTDFRGGKMDDITVVVATVRRSGSPKAAGVASDSRNSGLAAADGGGARADSSLQDR
ncbi:unnamed protein product [Laminaria digitata]